MDIDDLTYAQMKEIVQRLGFIAPQQPQHHEDKNKIADGPGIPVIVCTDKRGVIFGYTTNYHGDQITLTQARMCLYWSAEVGGVFGLAEKGPTKNCKISATAPSITLNGITAIISVDEAAENAWRNAPIQGR